MSIFETKCKVKKSIIRTFFVENFTIYNFYFTYFCNNIYRFKDKDFLYNTYNRILMVYVNFQFYANYCKVLYVGTKNTKNIFIKFLTSGNSA